MLFKPFTLVLSPFIFTLKQSYPTIYAEDSKEVESDLEKVVPLCGPATKKEVEETKSLWERTFDQPYEKAGGGIVLEPVVTSVKPPFYWDVSDTDFNSKYKSIQPRFLLEVNLPLSPNV